MSETVWHDEASRWQRNGHLDPPNQCLCDNCMAPSADLRAPEASA